MPFSEQKWKDALASIQTVNPELEKLLRAFWQQAKKPDWPNPILAKYYFGQQIIQSGEPKLPDNEPFTPDYLIGRNLPFGVIIENACEVSERFYSPRNTEANQYTPQNLLGRGETIGAFELKDFLADSSRPLINDWTVTSGALSIQSSINFNTDNAKTKLSKRGYTFARTSYKSCFAFLSALSKDGKPLNTRWHTTIIFLPRLLFEPLIKPPPSSIAAWQLRSYLGDIAWRGLSATAERTSRELQALFARSGHNSRDIDNSYKVIEQALQIVSGRRPCMAPAKADETLGPFSAFLEACFCAAGRKVPLMRPAFLSKGGVGYMQLQALAPFSDSESPGRAQISKINDVIANVLQHDIKDESLRPLVDMRRQVLEKNVYFRYPTAIAKSNEKEVDDVENGDAENEKRGIRDPKGGKTASTAKVVRPTLEYAAGKQPKEPTEISDEQYFHPHFDRKSLPPPKCRFFYAPTVRFLRSEDA